MTNLPTSLLAIVLGYRFGGIDGACVGAGVAWVLAYALNAAFAGPVAKKMDGYEKLALRALNELQVISGNLHRGFTSLNGYQVGIDAVWHDITRALARNPGITPAHLEDARDCVEWRFKRDGYLPRNDTDLLNIYGEHLAAMKAAGVSVHAPVAL